MNTATEKLPLDKAMPILKGSCVVVCGHCWDGLNHMLPVLFPEFAGKPVSHGICPNCLRGVLEQVETMKIERAA